MWSDAELRERKIAHERKSIEVLERELDEEIKSDHILSGVTILILEWKRARLAELEEAAADDLFRALKGDDDSDQS